jgi:thiamine pyrophosphate-dependent acetolactate synthase large subunit-like protein
MALASRLQAPVARTSRAKDYLEHDNPFDVGMTGIFGSEGGYETLLECDTLILLGCDFAWRQFYPDKATIIQIDIDGSHLGRRHPVDIGVVGDVGPTLDALLPLLPQRADGHFLETALERSVAQPGELEEAVRAWLAAPGPALLDVVVARNELVLPPRVETRQVMGMALYAAKGILAGGSRAKGVIDLIGDALRALRMRRRPRPVPPSCAGQTVR